MIVLLIVAILVGAMVILVKPIVAEANKPPINSVGIELFKIYTLTPEEVSENFLSPQVFAFFQSLYSKYPNIDFYQDHEIIDYVLTQIEDINFRNTTIITISSPKLNLKVEFWYAGVTWKCNVDLNSKT